MKQIVSFRVSKEHVEELRELSELTKTRRPDLLREIIRLGIREKISRVL